MARSLNINCRMSHLIRVGRSLELRFGPLGRDLLSHLVRICGACVTFKDDIPFVLQEITSLFTSLQILKCKGKGKGKVIPVLQLSITS
jgi:hypothetical protein